MKPGMLHPLRWTPAGFAQSVGRWLSVNLKQHGVDCGGIVGRKRS
jgi:hypothetical protein